MKGGAGVMNRCGQRGSFSNPNCTKKEHKICRLDYASDSELLFALMQQPTVFILIWFGICDTRVKVYLNSVLTNFFFFSG